jgi:hypothetical protein
VPGAGVPGAGVPGAGVGEADVAGVLEADDAGAPVVLVGVGVRVDETADEVVVFVTVTGALVPPEQPAANNATTAMATPNLFMTDPSTRRLVSTALTRTAGRWLRDWTAMAYP